MKRFRGTQYLEQRFWQKVTKTTDCWLWKAAKNAQGYGWFYLGKPVLAHRVSWLLAHPNEPIPQDKRVLHACDTPACVKPSHLFLGTQADNVADMFAKSRGRKAHGEQHGLSKLTEVQVVNVRRRLAMGESLQSIARKFNVSKSTIGCVKYGRTWSHIVRTGKVD